MALRVRIKEAPRFLRGYAPRLLRTLREQVSPLGGRFRTILRQVAHSARLSAVKGDFFHEVWAGSRFGVNRAERHSASPGGDISIVLHGCTPGWIMPQLHSVSSGLRSVSLAKTLGGFSGPHYVPFVQSVSSARTSSYGRRSICFLAWPNRMRWDVVLRRECNSPFLSRGGPLTNFLLVPGWLVSSLRTGPNNLGVLILGVSSLRILAPGR